MISCYTGPWTVTGTPRAGEERIGLHPNNTSIILNTSTGVKVPGTLPTLNDPQCLTRSVPLFDQSESFVQVLLADRLTGPSVVFFLGLEVQRSVNNTKKRNKIYQ